MSILQFYKLLTGCSKRCAVLAAYGCSKSSKGSKVLKVLISHSLERLICKQILLRVLKAKGEEAREAILEALKDIPDPISEEDNGNDDEGSAGTIGGEEVFECLLAFITVVERPKRQNSTKDAQQARQGVCP